MTSILLKSDNFLKKMFKENYLPIVPDANDADIELVLPDDDRNWNNLLYCWERKDYKQIQEILKELSKPVEIEFISPFGNETVAIKSQDYGRTLEDLANNLNFMGKLGENRVFTFRDSKNNLIQSSCTIGEFLKNTKDGFVHIDFDFNGAIISSTFSEICNKSCFENLC